MQMEGLWHWMTARQRLLVYVLGSSLVSVWTLLRFFTQRTVFDLISQQVIVHQWLHGTMSLVHLGKSAYVPKMLLLYVPLDSLPGSPRLKLIVLTVVINIATFVLLGIVIEKILRECGVRVGRAFYAALLLLAAVAGSVFWIQFANSRNLEVVGGVFWIYLGLRLLRTPNWKLATSLVLLGGILFFDDPLQLYMSALPVVAYGLVLAASKRASTKRVGLLIGAAAGSYIVAQLLFVAAGHLLQATFTDTGGVAAPPLSVSWLLSSATGVCKAVISLFAGASDGGRLREVLNLGLFGLGAVAFMYTLIKRLVPRRLLILITSIVVADITVYIASGQAVQGAATARYLIMLAPVAVMALSTIRLPKALRLYAGLAVGVGLAVNLVVLSSSLLQNWNVHFPRDQHIASTFRYAAEHPTTHVYASIDTAMAVQYYYHVPASTSLPVGCLNNLLLRTHFSMDQAFTLNNAQPNAATAIVFDGSTIANAPNNCTPQTVVRQFGPPISRDQTDDGSVVLLYGQASVRFPG